MSRLPWLDENSYLFPPCSSAMDEPNGLLAAGGDLSPERLTQAYRQGIFPWYSDGQPILWWSPDPRCIINPSKVHISKSLRRFIRKHPPTLRFNTAFKQVIQHCARLDSEDGTWITREMKEAYIALHEQGLAHSAELWSDNELIGGLYGIAMGRCFFGESMFSLQTNASKIVLAGLCLQLARWNYAILDCQVESQHLLTMGAESIDRSEFLSILVNNVDTPAQHNSWTFDDSIFQFARQDAG